MQSTYARTVNNLFFERPFYPTSAFLPSCDQNYWISQKLDNAQSRGAYSCYYIIQWINQLKFAFFVPNEIIHLIFLYYKDVIKCQFHKFLTETTHFEMLSHFLISKTSPFRNVVGCIEKPHYQEYRLILSVPKFTRKYVNFEQMTSFG